MLNVGGDRRGHPARDVLGEGAVAGVDELILAGHAAFSSRNAEEHPAFIDGLARHRGVDRRGAGAIRRLHAVGQVIDQSAPQLFGLGQRLAAVFGGAVELQAHRG